jgi:pyridoxal phosphate-dependent aminotransferase EpsN
MVQPFIFLSPPKLAVNTQDNLSQAIASNYIAPNGPFVAQFEEEMAFKIKSPYCIALNSGTSALHLALILAGVQMGDQVLCASNTFVASANPALYLGAEPVFIGSEATTWNICPNALEDALRSLSKKNMKPKALVMAHIYGNPAKMKDILEVCTKYDVRLIEDAAESLGSKIRDTMTGTFGDYGVYSFNGNKIITASAGGMLVVKSEEAKRKAKFLATQAKDLAPFYSHSEVGFNYSMSNLLAAIGSAQLEELDQRVVFRRKLFAQYQSTLQDLGDFRFQSELDDALSNRWLTTVVFNKIVEHQKMVDFFRSCGIETRPLWKPLHTQKLFKDSLYFGNHFENDIFLKGICLPSGDHVTQETFTRVINTLRNYILTV